MQQLKIFSWNVNGVRAVERKGFLNWFAASGGDIIALQETKASPSQLSPELAAPAGYYTEWCDSVTKGYCGVATFARPQPLATARGLGDARFDNDGRVLISTFADFTFYNIYFPSGNRGPQWVEHKLAFYKRFLELVTPQIAAGTPVIVVGDVNTAFAEIDLARPRENSKTSGFMPEERAAMGEFFSAGLVDSFRHMHPDEARYSWWSQRTGARARNIGWRLDYIFVSPNLVDRIVAAEIHPEVEGSDHCPVSVTLALG